MSRRSKLEMYISILDSLAGRGPTSPTTIMYEVNICYTFLEDYLRSLVDRGLVEKSVFGEKRSSYVLTQKGRVTLEKFKALSHLFSKSAEENKADSFAILAEG